MLQGSVRASIPQHERGITKRQRPLALSEMSHARWRGKAFDKKLWLRCNHCFLRGIRACPELVEGGEPGKTKLTERQSSKAEGILL